MIALWLIEFLWIALIVIALVWAIQQMIARARSREWAQSYAQDLMRYDEARQLVPQQARRLVEQGIPFEQAALTALSDDYWKGGAENLYPLLMMKMLSEQVGVNPRPER
jgi:hypothetical protein